MEGALCIKWPDVSLGPCSACVDWSNVGRWLAGLGCCGAHWCVIYCRPDRAFIASSLNPSTEQWSVVMNTMLPSTRTLTLLYHTGSPL